MDDATSKTISSKHYSKMFSKKFVTTFLRDSIDVRPFSIVRLFETPIYEAKMSGQEINFQNHTIININPYTLEEQLIMYPSAVIVHHTHNFPPNVIIDIE